MGTMRDRPGRVCAYGGGHVCMCVCGEGHVCVVWSYMYVCVVGVMCVYMCGWGHMCVYVWYGSCVCICRVESFVCVGWGSCMCICVGEVIRV